ncbi:thioesterase family protein [Litorimonas sp. RW-G-Af-16]|uniref:thioesterase family protein n=1 Tax=Litorimonas sp. RW-G-Af-16 TaxID=3241168 RepID=UPI00390CDAA1
MDGFVLTWAGECSSWECDDLGHLNMRYYVRKFGQARAGLFVRLGLTHAYKPGTSSTVRVRDFHIRYQAEAHPGNPLKVMSAILQLHEDTVQLCHIMYHEDGRVAASAVETVEHFYLTAHRTFAWPKRVQLSAKTFTVPMPDVAKPRNIDLSVAHIGRTAQVLRDAGLCPVGTGVFEASETDITEYVTAGAIFGRTTSSIAWFRDGWPELYDHAYREANLSAALLEARLVFHNHPQQGDAYDYMPVLVGADAYTRRFVHNLVDPISGESWATMEACGCKFDLNTRRLIKMTEADIASLMAAAKPDLTP